MDDFFNFAVEFAVGSTGIRVHPAHCRAGQLRAFSFVELRSASSTTRRIVDEVVPDAAVPRGTVRLPVWMQVHDIDIGAGIVQQSPTRPTERLIVSQLSGAYECGGDMMHGDEDVMCECICRQLAGVVVARDSVFALNVRGCQCVFLVHAVDRDTACTVHRTTAVSLRAPHELVPSRARRVGALRLYAEELLDAVVARFALKAVPSALRSCGIVLVSGARGSGKSTVLALLRDALDARAVQVRCFDGVDCAGRTEDALVRKFSTRDGDIASLVIIVDDLFAAADAPVWRALARASSSHQQSQWCAVVASTHFSVPSELVGATVALRAPMIDAVLGDSLPALTHALPPIAARRAAAHASDQLRRQRDDRGRGGHDLVSAVRRAALFASADSDLSATTNTTTSLDALDSVPGYVELKAQLRELLVWPLQHHDAMARLGVTAARGVLLEGPSGCGKTLLATALLQSVPFAVFAVKASDLLSRYLGGTERAIRELFARARRAAPSVVWIDEIDVLAARREHEAGDGGDDALGRRTLSALLAELDGVGERDGVVILAATSRLAHIDAALLRPGRFDRVLHVGAPSLADRAAIVAHYVARAPASRLSADDIERVAVQTDGRSCAELAALHREAAFAALRDAHGDTARRQVTLEAKHYFFTLDARAV